jgi:hypothetical protein
MAIMKLDILIAVFSIVVGSWYIVTLLTWEITYQNQINKLQREDRPVVVNGYWTINGNRFSAMKEKHKSIFNNFLKQKRNGKNQ